MCGVFSADMISSGKPVPWMLRESFLLAGISRAALLAEFRVASHKGKISCSAKTARRRSSDAVFRAGATASQTEDGPGGYGLAFVAYFGCCALCTTTSSSLLSAFFRPGSRRSRWAFLGAGPSALRMADHREPEYWQRRPGGSAHGWRHRFRPSWKS